MPFVPGFKPTTNAPLFPNGPWPTGTVIGPITIPGLPQVTIDATQMGFCGGMAFLTRDIFESGTPQLRAPDSTRIPVPLAKMILDRLVQSFLGPGVVDRWVHATSELDHGTVALGPGLFAETVGECAGITADIDAGRLCPIGVVLVQSYGAWDVFQNHVELVWGYERNGDILTLHVYDCNNPNTDGTVIQLDVSSPTPAKSITTNGTSEPTNAGHIRGFFRLPYTHADPSAAYIDDGVATTVEQPSAQIAAGTKAPCAISVTNTGSTTWTSAAGYRLGSQWPQDNATWGMSRVPLPGNGTLDPQQTTEILFTATAPGAGQYDFAWQMVREMVHWFGTPTTVVPIAVGASGGVCDALHQQHVALVQQLQEVQAEIAAVDWSDPVTARHEAAGLALKARNLQTAISGLEAKQAASGCAPG